MKIVYLIHQFYPEFYTGTEKFVLNLSSMIQKAGNRVKIITYSFYEDSFYDQRRGEILGKEFTYKGIPILAIRHKRLPDDLNHAIGNMALTEVAGDVISMERPDIVHVGHPMRVGALVQALGPLDIPYILTLTDFFLPCPKVNLVPSRQPLCSGPEGGQACAKLCPELQSNYVDERLEVAKRILFKARLLVAPSAFVAGVFNREFPGLEVKVISHGLNFQRLKRNDKSYARGDRVVFCYAGSFNFHKGTHLLVEAFMRINSRNALLRMYGSGPDPLYVDNLMTLAGENDNIEFCGLYSEDKTGDILSSVDVIVIPSLCYESYSMILHEALACNVPVVAADLGGLAEKICDGVNGFLFKMGDSRHLQAVLQKIAEDPALLNPLKQNINSMVIQGVEQEAYTYARAYHMAQGRGTSRRGTGKPLSLWSSFFTKRFEGLEHASGYVDEMVYDTDGLLVRGWMLLPRGELGSICVYLNDNFVGYAEPEIRLDVGRAFPHLLHAARSGFRFYAKLPSGETTEIARLDLIAFMNGQPVAKMTSLYRAGLDRAVPTPPPELMERASGTRDAQVFKLAGLKSFGEFLGVILRYREIASIRRLLDWGCGPGRVCVHFLAAEDGPEVFGCDVDSEAIDWCSEKLRPGNFSVVHPWPPTPYRDSMFDVVIGSSIFTHLSREAHKSWLAEIKRIMAPGGLFITSVLGDSAALAVTGASRAIMRHGIFDRIRDATVNGIVPKGYYRVTFQGRDYTFRECSKYFEILEYIERGMSNHEDLIVMRRSG